MRHLNSTSIKFQTHIKIWKPQTATALRDAYRFWWDIHNKAVKPDLIWRLCFTVYSLAFPENYRYFKLSQFSISFTYVVYCMASLLPIFVNVWICCLRGGEELWKEDAKDILGPGIKRGPGSQKKWLHIHICNEMGRGPNRTLFPLITFLSVVLPQGHNSSWHLTFFQTHTEDIFLLL